MSAVASVTIAGITVIGMRLEVASATSMSEGVIFIEAMARRFGFAAITSRSIRSWSRQNRMSLLATAAHRDSLSKMRKGSGLNSTSATARRRSIALLATGWVR